jgi:ribosomal 50S subunit-associated protein YjgA (DUF615 family)
MTERLETAIEDMVGQFPDLYRATVRRLLRALVQAVIEEPRP